MNPFRPFIPVFGENFINRQNDINSILGRIPRLGHTAVVGNPHVGKTSLLRHLMFDSTVFGSIVPQPERYALADIDFQLFGESKTPNDFWRELLTQATEYNSEIASPFKKLLSKKRKLDEQVLYRAFQQVAATGGCVITFIDEFDHLFNLERFFTLNFLSVLRVIAMKSGGLVIVTASRLSVAQMNEKGRYLKATRGSDLFNYLEEHPLAGFKDEIIRSWLEHHFQEQEAIDEIIFMAGHHPLLLQLESQLLFDTIAQGIQPVDYPSLRDSFSNKAESQFQDVWNYLSDKAQIALIIFALQDLQGRGGGQTFNLENTDQILQWYQTEIKDMARRGTLEQHEDADYHFGSAAFRAWIVENKIVGSRGDEPEEAFTQWLHNKEFKLGGLITNEEIAWLHKAWRAVSDEVIKIAKKALLPENLQ